MDFSQIWTHDSRCGGVEYGVDQRTPSSVSYLSSDMMDDCSLCFSLVYTFVFVFLNLVTRYKSWYCMKLSVERLIKVVGMCLTEESFTLILSVFVCTCEGTERKRLCMLNCTVKKNIGVNH